MILRTTLILLLALLFPCCAHPAPRPIFSNPLLTKDAAAGADPDILYYQGVYYFYSTNSGNHVFTSPDLIHWTRGPQILPDSFKGMWAPEVLQNPADGKFYMYYTNKYKIGVAVADRPDGMFKDLGLLVINAIDADIFRDDDGRLYLYFTNTPSFTMYCVPMKSFTETGGPVTKCFAISQDWEKHSFPINEGPWMLKHDGTYYLLYSGSDGQSIYYAIGYATAPTPIGPFTKYEKNPIFQNLPAINGSGHCTVVRDRAGQLWQFYTQKTDAAHGWQREICVDPVHFDGKGIFSGTPTRNLPEATPNCDPATLWSPDSHPRGAIFHDPISVTLTTNSSDAEIRYTTNGADPAQSSGKYIGPITLTKTTTLKSRTFKSGFEPSAVTVTHFTRTSDPMPANPSPDEDPGAPPFTVFPTPNLNWKPPTKPVASQPATAPG